MQYLPPPLCAGGVAVISLRRRTGIGPFRVRGSDARSKEGWLGDRRSRRGRSRRGASGARHAARRAGRPRGRMSAPTAVHDGTLRSLAERVATAPVPRSALALAFDETTAATADVFVEGRNFYPPMLADIEGASSSIHINQFGFRPGVVGDAFAEALVAKAREGVAVRVVVDRQGSDPERGARALYEQLTVAGVQVCVV